MLRLKALLTAFGEKEPLLVAFEGGFDASPALIVEGHISGPDCNGISRLRTGVPEHREDLFSRQRADQHAVGEGPVLSATAHSNAASLGEHSGKFTQGWSDVERKGGKSTCMLGIGGYHPGHGAPDAASSFDILESGPLSTHTRNEWWNAFTPAPDAE